MKKVLLLSLLLSNLSFAGTMINPKIDTRNNSKTYISIGRNQNQSKSGKVYNDKVMIKQTINNTTTSNKTDKSSNITNSKTKNNNFSADIKTNVNGLQKFLTDMVY